MIIVDDHRSFHHDDVQELKVHHHHHHHRDLHSLYSNEVMFQCRNDVDDDDCRVSMFHWMLDEDNHRMMMKMKWHFYVDKNNWMMMMLMMMTRLNCSSLSLILAEKVMLMMNVMMLNEHVDKHVDHHLDQDLLLFVVGEEDRSIHYLNDNYPLAINDDH